MIDNEELIPFVPTYRYVIFADFAAAKAYQARVDEVLNYPEPLDQLTNIGAGPWVPKDLGRAAHYAEIIPDQTGARFALPLCDSVPPSEGEKVEALPTNWYPTAR